MAETTIQWTWRRLPDGTWIIGYTFNPWWGCLKVSEECRFCYAEGIAHHYGHQVWGPAVTTPRRLFGPGHWQEPLRWNRQAEQDGHRRAVFCASMADVFEEHPDVEGERQKLWKLIDATPWLNWLLLTKRPENILQMAPWNAGNWPDHVWVGTSIGLQRRAEERLPRLLEVPAVVRFVSCEPLLEPLDLAPWLAGLHWIICGGESGYEARPMNPEWARSLRNQCLAAGVPFFFKQHGGRYHHSGGRLLDGRIWDEMPPERPEKQVPSMREVQRCPASI
jgi:protein gp37